MCSCLVTSVQCRVALLVPFSNHSSTPGLPCALHYRRCPFGAALAIDGDNLQCDSSFLSVICSEIEPEMSLCLGFAYVATAGGRTLSKDKSCG